MGVRFQKTARGEVAILPRKEYERLVARAAEADEDAGTARLVARARKEIASGGPLLPKDIADRLANGENPVRVLREWRERDRSEGMTQMYLSFKTGLSQSYISDIENGRRKGTAAALRVIANALDVPLDLLVGDS
jgi:ribosome-binding protein aMBF1 (putative translation factor)